MSEPYKFFISAQGFFLFDYNGSAMLSLYLILEKELSFSRNNNQFHDILRLLDVLPNFLFTTSETMGHYYLET